MKRSFFRFPFMFAPPGKNQSKPTKLTDKNIAITPTAGYNAYTTTLRKHEETVRRIAAQACPLTPEQRTEESRRIAGAIRLRASAQPHEPSSGKENAPAPPV